MHSVHLRSLGSENIGTKITSRLRSVLGVEPRTFWMKTAVFPSTLRRRLRTVQIFGSDRCNCTDCKNRSLLDQIRGLIKCRSHNAMTSTQRAGKIRNVKSLTLRTLNRFLNSPVQKIQIEGKRSKTSRSSRKRRSQQFF